jgi:NAD(P)-dependent dehydrogenase (short-subunit alcohol dehydrogenase family)
MTDSLNVLITGGSSGIGEALAYLYARRGARLALFARRTERLEAVAKLCLERGAKEARVLTGDTTVRKDVVAAAAELEAWPSIDRAYLNAGTSFGIDKDGERGHFLECCSSGNVTAEDFSADVVEDAMRVNFVGVVYWLEPLFRRMRAQRSGTIAVTGSLAGDRALPRSAAYSASKTAVRVLVDGLRFDATRYGIRLCMIEPGFVETQDADPDRYVMPFLMPVGAAAERIFRGVEAGRRSIRFPWQAAILSRIGAMMPDFIYERWAAYALAPRRARKPPALKE